MAPAANPAPPPPNPSGNDANRTNGRTDEQDEQEKQRSWRGAYDAFKYARKELKGAYQSYDRDPNRAPGRWAQLKHAYKANKTAILWVGGLALFANPVVGGLAAIGFAIKHALWEKRPSWEEVRQVFGAAWNGFRGTGPKDVPIITPEERQQTERDIRAGREPRLDVDGRMAENQRDVAESRAAKQTEPARPQQRSSPRELSGPERNLSSPSLDPNGNAPDAPDSSRGRSAKQHAQDQNRRALIILRSLGVAIEGNPTNQLRRGFQDRENQPPNELIDTCAKRFSEHLSSIKDPGEQAATVDKTRSALREFRAGLGNSANNAKLEQLMGFMQQGFDQAVSEPGLDQRLPDRSPDAPDPVAGAPEAPTGPKGLEGLDGLEGPGLGGPR